MSLAVQKRLSTSLASLAAIVKALPGSPPGLAALIKYTVTLLVLINVRSFPFAWHIRVFAPLISLRIQYAFLRLRLLLTFTSKARATKVKQAWLDKLSPVGQNPLSLRVIHRSWAGPDDSDYNFHLSNSCYPKIMDGARLKAALKLCPSFFRHGGWMALGATHHHFIREIPIFASYEVRIDVATWDQKWIYVVCRFVTKGKGKSSKHAAQSNGPTALPAIHTPATPLETPPGARTPATDNGDTNTDVGASAARLARAQAAQPEADGATLHCVAVSVLCFKHGRITVPPALALASEGFCAPAAAGLAPYSHANPPPSWVQHAQALRAEANGRAFAKFVRGGWRDVPEGERWWEQALGGEVERVRAERLGPISGLMSGMAVAREYQALPA